MPLPDLGERRAPAATLPLAVWWAIWLGILSSLVLIYVFVGRGFPRPPENTTLSVVEYVAVGPIIISALLRWLWLPRVTQAQPALVVFIIGHALAECTGFIGIFLSNQPATFTVLGVLGLVQWMPLFATRLSAAPPALR